MPCPRSRVTFLPSSVTKSLSISLFSTSWAGQMTGTCSRADVFLATDVTFFFLVKSVTRKCCHMKGPGVTQVPDRGSPCQDLENSSESRCQCNKPKHLPYASSSSLVRYEMLGIVILSMSFIGTYYIEINNHG